MMTASILQLANARTPKILPRSPWRVVPTLPAIVLGIVCSLSAQQNIVRPNSADPSDPFNSPSVAKSPASHAQMERWRSEIRAALLLQNPAPPLRPQSFGTFEPMSGMAAHRVTYGTKFGMRIPAVVYEPQRPKSKLPAILVVGGHGGDKTTWYSVYTGLLYAKSGAVVLTYDPLGEDERNAEHRSDARAHDAVIPGPDAALETGSLMLTDILQGVSYLRTLPEVDPSRIAVVAYSMGTVQAVLAAAVDPRIHVLVLSGGGNMDGNGGVWDTENKPMCQAGLYRSLSFLPDKGAILYALHQQVGPTLILNGRLDPLVGRPHHFDDFFANLSDRVAAIAGPKAPRIEYRFLADVGHRPSWMTLSSAEWLNAQLHLPNWRDVDLSSAGTTHISEWAQTTGAHINTGYSDEEREGGIRALGTGFPSVSRNELQVVPMTEWEKSKDLYIWQAWQNRVLDMEGLPRSAAVKPPPPR